MRLGTTVIILVVVGTSYSAAGFSSYETSWNGSEIAVKIPSNFPMGIPIVTFPLLTDPINPLDEEARKEAEEAKASSSSARSSKLSSHFGSGVSLFRREETLAQLRLPTNVEDGMDMGDGGGGGGGGSGSRSSFQNKENSRLQILNYKGDLFDTTVQHSSSKDPITIRLRRNIELRDHTEYGSRNKDFLLEIGRPSSSSSGKRKDKRDVIIFIRVIIGSAINCDDLDRFACWFPEEPIRIQQWENRDRSPLVKLSSISSICPGVRTTYNVLIKDNLLTSATDRFSLKPKIPLDRERYGSSVKFQISCTIKLDKNKITQHRDGELLILDEDDSPPIMIRNPTVMWHYSNRTEDLDDQMMVVDPDLRDTNQYEMILEGKTYNMVTIDSIVKFNTRSELCTNATGKDLPAECMLLTPGLKLKYDKYGKKDLSECHEDYPAHCAEVMSFNEATQRKNVPLTIKFSVVIIDRTLIKRNPSISNRVKYDVELTLPPCEEDSSPSPKWARLLEEDTPKEINITVPSYVGRFYRLAQLTDTIMSVSDLKQEPSSAYSFSLSPMSMHMGVGITRINGILYIDDPEMLMEGDIVVLRGEVLATTVHLTINAVDPNPCPQLDQGEDFEWCSSKDHNVTCESTCGVGSGGVCSWRPRSNDNDNQYATCSPDFDTCPDRVCDELEHLSRGICPQDCIDKTDFTGTTLGTFGPEGLGMLTCREIFSCNTGGKCVCSPRLPEIDDDDPVLRERQHPRSGCGMACQVGVTLVGLIFIFTIVAIVLFCKHKTISRRMHKSGVVSLGSFQIDERSSMAYTRGDEPHDIVHHGIRASPRPEHNFIPTVNVTQVDQKWEFPRNRLVIEQTLGEGEFGKVMRAKAQGINGSLGYTTVAVKMLKPNSTPAELNDLLSEYSLLKEVSHPNVVKLLGACTAKGGPIYIIIEYCQYGSLRNYLKRSRHAEFENRVGSGPADFGTADYNVTPKDILSFAWQISKGMAYLTDMKLVHRDLAARNVLLAGGKVCKISDFGLTRDVYEGDLYFKRSKGRVPVKWMALESLVDHVYTSKSDVWGFGVLLWELVTLGTLPYPGVQPERLFTLLKAGYRMEKPENCSPELYDVMLQCWAENPNRRPCFQDLTEIFEGMIQADVEYLELRSLIVTNRSYFDSDPLPDPPQQFQDPPTQIRITSQPLAQRNQPFQDNVDTSPDSSPQMDDLNNPELDWSPPSSQLDADTYLVARTDIKRSRREDISEPLLSAISPNSHAANTPIITTSHAHNPSYTASGEIMHHPLHYSTLANRPDEEDINTLECCRSEEDSDNSGRATGDSGYTTEEGRMRWKGDHKGASRSTLTSPRGSYSPIPRLTQDPDDDQDPEDDQDTSEDLEERQELLNEEILGHLTPSPEPAHTAQSTRTAHSSHAAHRSHSRPVIV